MCTKEKKNMKKWKTHRFPLRNNIFVFLIAELNFGYNFTLEYIYYMPYLELMKKQWFDSKTWLVSRILSYEYLENKFSWKM